jgi:BMFP domain-containing protein YqiC
MKPMDEVAKVLALVAKDLAATIRTHVSERLAPIGVEIVELRALASQQRAQIDELQARLADLEAKAATIRRVA